MDERRRDDEKETGRVEAFSDGVIAIAITLLILEIKVPKVSEMASVSLGPRLLGRQYRFGPLLYLIAFGLAFVSVAASIAACLALAIFFAFAGRPTCAFKG